MNHLKRLITGLIVGGLLFGVGYIVAGLLFDLSTLDTVDVITFTVITTFAMGIAYLVGWSLLEEFGGRNK